MKKYIYISLCALCVSLTTATRAQNIFTVAGNGTQGFSGDNAAATAAQMNFPGWVTTDVGGNIYIAEANNQRIRKISPTGIITTIAGTGVALYTGDGFPAISATLNYPAGVAVDAAGNVYIADNGNHCIRKVDVNGIIHTIAGHGVSGYTGDNGPAAAATLFLPCGLAFDATGNLYIADNGNHCIRKITMSTGVITTVAGTGVGGMAGDLGAATAALLQSPRGITLDAVGNLYVADDANYNVRKITAATGVIKTIAGNGVFGYSGDNGPATAASMHSGCVAVDATGNVYITDPANYRIRKVSAATGIITTVAGTGVTGFSPDNTVATAAQISRPWGICMDNAGTIFFADQTNHRVRKIVTTPVVSGVDDKQADAPVVRVFPNPNNGVFTINIESALQEQVQVLLTDITGRVVADMNVATNEAVQMRSDNGNGMHLLSVISSGKRHDQKVMIVR